MNIKIKIALILLIAAVTAAGCKKEDNFNEFSENETHKLQKRLDTNGLYEYIFSATGIDIYEFANDENFLALEIPYASADNIYTLSSIEAIATQYDNFKDNINNSVYSSLSADLKAMVLDAADDIVCYGSNRINGWGTFKFRVWLAGLMWSLELVNDEEYKELVEYAVEKLNEKNGREVLIIVWEE